MKPYYYLVISQQFSSMARFKGKNTQAAISEKFWASCRASSSSWKQWQMKMLISTVPFESAWTRKKKECIQTSEMAYLHNLLFDNQKIFKCPFDKYFFETLKSITEYLKQRLFTSFWFSDITMPWYMRFQSWVIFGVFEDILCWWAFSKTFVNCLFLLLCFCFSPYMEYFPIHFLPPLPHGKFSIDEWKLGISCLENFTESRWNFLGGFLLP